MASYLPNVTDVFPTPALYTPDFSFIDTMLRRRQQMYEQGYSQVAGQYQRIMSDMSHKDNIAFRDKFMKQAMSNMTNLAQMDLSQQQNVNNAVNLFKPYYQNTDALWDQQYTKHVNAQEAIYQAALAKDGGKEASLDNIELVRMQQREFQNSPVNTAGSFYANRASYKPYFDYKKEFAEAMKDFKPNSYKIDDLNGLYKITNSDKSWKEKDIFRFLQGRMSKQAYEQMATEAYVRYGHDPNKTLQVFINNAQNELDMYKSTIKDLEVLKKSYKKASDIQQIETTIKTYQDKADRIENAITQIKSGKTDFATKDWARNYATDNYIKNQIADFSSSQSHEDIERTVNPDEVNLRIYLQEDQQRHALQMKLLDQQFELEKEEKKKQDALGISNPNFVNLPDQPDGSGLAFSERVQGEIDDHTNKMSNINDQLRNHVAVMTGNKDPKSVTAEAVSAYLKNNTQDITAQDLQNRLRKEAASLDLARQQMNQMNDYIMSNMGPESKRSFQEINDYIQKNPTVTLDDGTVVNTREVYESMLNGTAKASTPFIDGLINTLKNTFLAPMGFSGMADTENLTYKDGRKIETVLSFAGGNKNAGFNLFLNNLQNLMSNNNGLAEYQELRNRFNEKELPKMNLFNKVLTISNSETDEYKFMSSQLNGLLAGTREDYKTNIYGVGFDQSNQGNLYFTLSKAKEGSPNLTKSTYTDIITSLNTQLAGSGAKASLRTLDDKKNIHMIELKGWNHPYVKHTMKFTDQEAKIIQYLTSGGSASQNFIPRTSNNPQITYQIKSNNNMYYLYANDNTPFSDTPIHSETEPSDALKYANHFAASKVDVVNGKRVEIDNFLLRKHRELQMKEQQSTSK